MKLKKEMKQLLITFLHNEIIVLSWGISNIKINNNILIFEVSGFRYSGIVKISLGQKGYKIELSDRQLNCCIDNVVSILDKEIELTEHYTSDIIRMIKK